NQNGQPGADKIQLVVTHLQEGKQPVVSNTIPKPGDFMVWGPDKGGPRAGQAGDHGHIAVVDSVTQNKDGTYTVHVTERGWKDDKGKPTNGERDITLQPGKTPGTLVTGDGVGFVTSDPTPQVGPNEPHDPQPGWAIDDTPAHQPVH